MGLIFGLIRWLLKSAIYLVLVILMVALIPYLPPFTKFTSIELEPTLPREGPLKLNGDMNNARQLYKGKVIDPEDLEVYNGEVYAAVGTGEVVKLSPGGHVTFVTKLGPPCENPIQQYKCGRPLGIQIDQKTGQLYVADAYYGIWKVDIKTDKKQLLVSPRVEIDGRKPALFNSVGLGKNGDVYWTDSTSDYPLHKGFMSMVADPSGRLFHYNAATNSSRVLLDGLWFANGVAVTPDNQAVVVAESFRYRLVKYYLQGPKKGQSEVILAGLPGVPDNLKPLPDGSGFLVGLYLVFPEDEPFLPYSFAKTPLVRKFIARVLTLAAMPFEQINKYFPNPTIEHIANTIGSFQMFSSLITKKSGLLVVDWNGKIVEGYYNIDGSLAYTCDAVVYQDKLLTGSPHLQDFVGAVPAPPLLKKAFASIQSTPPPKTAETVTKPIPKKVEEKKQTAPPPKPTTTTPKPTTTTTTTPKPTTTKPTTPKPTTTTTTTQKPTTTKTTTPKPTTTAKPTTTTTTTPKPTTTPPPPKTTPPIKKSETAKPVETKPSKQIPIKEEIPSDTAKPTNEKLKVIKKGGPTEIPNPEL